jgi:glycosyltransferase involved in cell wall biosynthesis
MNSKRVLFCIPSYTFGGAEKHSFQTARVFLEEGFEVYFLAFGKKDGFELLLKSKGIHTLHIDLGNFHESTFVNKWFTLTHVLFLVRKIRPEYIFSGTKQENVLMGLIWRFSGSKKFFWHQWGIDESSVSRLERFCALFKPSYVANSRACSKNIAERHRLMSQELVRIIHNPVSLPTVTIITHSSDNFRILMTANFFPEKDHETVIRAVHLLNRRYPDNTIQLLFAGSAPGVSGQLEKCKALAFDLELSKNQVQFLGKVEDMASLLLSCQLGVLSTRSEGLSNAILEYMSYGLPVIATKIDQNLEALGKENESWLFALGDVDACARLIEKAYLQREVLEPAVKANQQRVKDNFSFENYKKNVLRLVNA